MAFTAKFELHEQLHSNVYVRIVKATTSVADREFYKVVDDDKIVEQLDWVRYYESFGVAYIYLDEDCRRRNVHPIHVQQFRFDYDMNSADNIYKQAYQQLMSTKDLFQDVVSV